MTSDPYLFDNEESFWTVFKNSNAHAMRKAGCTKRTICLGTIATMHGRETIYLDLDDDERFGGYSTGHPDTAKNERYFRILGTIRFGREALLASRTGYMAAIEVSKEGVCGNIVALWNAVPMHKHDYIEIEDDEWDTVVERHEKLRPCGLANSDLSGQLLVLADSVDGIGQALQVRNIVSNDLCATRAKLYGMDVAHVSFLS